MKIALISDIHGNIPALESVLNDINRKKADKIICLGDIVGKGPSSPEALDRCRSDCDLIIRGNWEALIYNVFHNNPLDLPASAIARAHWYIKQIGPERIEFLGSLTHSYELTFSGRLIRMFHAHPIDFSRYYSFSPLEKRLELFESGRNPSADIAIYADIHTAYMQMLEGKTLLNIGSVGNPLDLPEASYVILEGAEGMDSGAGLNIQFVRVPYDTAKVVRTAQECGLPDLEGYIQEITTAKYFCRT